MGRTTLERLELPTDPAVLWTPVPPPVATSSEDWIGLPVALHSLPGCGRYEHVELSLSGVAVARNGRGKRWYSSGTRRRDLYTAPRMIDTYGAGTSFDWFSTEGEPGEIVTVEFPPTLLQRWLHDDAPAFVLMMRHEVFDERLASLLFLLWDEASSHGPRGKLYIEGLCAALLGLLTASYCERDASIKRYAGRFSVRQRQRLDELIATELHTKLSVARMAEVVGLSPIHFARTFRGTFAQSPYSFVLNRRIEAACIALRRHPDMTVAEIAFTYGFSSQAHFAEAFRSKTGTSPSLWRKSA